MHCVSSCDKRTSYVPCLQLLLIVWAGRETINILPDDVLLHIFHFDGLLYRHKGFWEPLDWDGMRDDDRMLRLTWNWHRLAHVCRRWRSIIFASPNFLDLRLVCLPGTRLELTGIWPPFPIIISDAVYDVVYNKLRKTFDFDAAIVHTDRVREINLIYLTRPRLQRLVFQMHVQFPALVRLVICCQDRRYNVPALPDGFLGGSAPQLQYFGLHRIPFPALPKFLLSATGLVYLVLKSIPDSGCFSPEAIVTGLAAMANLKSLTIEFCSPVYPRYRNHQRSPPPIRTILPALTHFWFEGDSEYLEDLMARVDAPLLTFFSITFFNQTIFDIPQVAQFMRRMTRFRALNEAYTCISEFGFLVRYPLPAESGESVALSISCGNSDWRLSSLARVLTSIFPEILIGSNNE